MELAYSCFYTAPAASIANLVGSNEKELSDSENVKDALLGTATKGRSELLLEASQKTALRKGDWLFIPPYPGGQKINKQVNIELGSDEVAQLYNLKEDRGQQHNLAVSNPEKLEELQKVFIEKRGENYFRGIKKMVLH